MGKYLDEIDLIPCNLYEKSMEIKFNEETSFFLYFLNTFITRNVYSNYGKLVVMIWPKGELSKGDYPIPRYEFDSMSNVAVINMEFDIAQYFSESTQEERSAVVYGILKDGLTQLPEEFGLDESYVTKFLDSIRDSGFVYKERSSKRISNSTKNISASLYYLFNETGLHVSAIIESKERADEIHVPITSYTIYEFRGVLSTRSKLKFLGDEKLIFEPFNKNLKKIQVSIDSKVS